MCTFSYLHVCLLLALAFCLGSNYNEVHIIYLILPVQATRKNIPILIDAERKREGLDGLLQLASYAVCSAKFPQASLIIL